MEGEQFSLCWNNFHTNLSSGFNNLFKDEDLVDVTLAAGGRFLKAHKTVLSICSPFFKELFRANPSKHPIVILPDVNYNALTSLMHFMYQGEVSVSQEEIPVFMRVAEMLKVKGLTDNSSASSSSSSESNGYASRSPYHSDQRLPLKRPFPQPSPSHQASAPQRPIKKPTKPVQPPHPPRPVTDSPKPPRSPLPSPLKRSYLDDHPGRSFDAERALVQPKQEPPDSEEEFGAFEDSNMDLSAMLDAKLGESSKWQQVEREENKSQDSSTPGTLQCILGKRGNPRLIVDGYVFYKKSVYKGKAFWYCKNSRAPEKCQAVCWTMNGNIVKWPYVHTHPVIPDVFNPDEDTEVPIQNLQEVLWQTSYS